MAGGVFIQEDKQLAGVYINIASSSLNIIPTGTTGVVMMPVVLDYGIAGGVTKVTGGTSLSKVFHTTATESHAVYLIQEALRNSEAVYVYNLADEGTAKAKVTGVGSFYSKASGNLTNNLRIVIEESPNASGIPSYNVYTYFGSELLATQTGIDVVEDIKSNAYFTFVGESASLKNAPTPTAGVTMSGGTTEVANYTGNIGKFITEADKYQFNVLSAPLYEYAHPYMRLEESTIADESRQSLRAIAEYTIFAREKRGRFFQTVVPVTLDYTTSMDGVPIAYNHEAITVVGNGVTLANGTNVPPHVATAWVSGASAGAGVDTSLTYVTYPNAVDAYPRYSEEDQISALQRGVFIFIEKRGTAVVLQDINNLTTYTVEKNQDFSKNKIIRLINDFYLTSRIVFEDNYIGKVPNSLEGRELFRANRITYFTSLASAGVIENFVADDIVVSQGASKDTVILEVAVQPVDAMEKLYIYLNIV